MKKVTAKEFEAKILRRAAQKNPRTMMVYGVPGIGKTRVIRDSAAKCNRKYITLSLGRVEAYDVKGVPNNAGEYVRWVPPVFWKQVIDCKGECIVHFDEFTLASDDVQGAILDVVLDKRIDELVLPNRVLFILSGNMGGDDGTSARAVTSALTGGRGFTYKMQPPRVDEWVAFQNPLARIKEFILTSKKSIYTGPNLKEPFEPWTCPRAWSQLDDTLKDIQEIEGLDMDSEEAVVTILDEAEAILSESTVGSLREFLKDAIIDADALLKGEEAMWNKYIRAKELKRSFALNEVVELCDMKKNPKRWRSEEARRDAVQKLVTKLAEDTNTEAETMATMLDKLSDLDPFMLQGVTVKGVDIGAHFDKLLKQKIAGSKKGTDTKGKK